MQPSMLVPGYYPKIVEIIRAADWLLHNFPDHTLDIYNAVDFQHNRQTEGIKYEILLDLNFLQYLLNVVKKPKSTEHSRSAAAYLVFFKISDIQLDPTYAIYEKINYSNDKADEAISHLECFRGIDNHSLDELAAYALGYEQQLHISSIASKNRNELRAGLLQYRRLTDWDSLYLCVLLITKISIDSSIPRSQKPLAFVEWCISEFRFSVSALAYAVALFGRRPAKKMMKYKAKASSQKREGSLSNMTWDLYYIDRYMKSWVSNDEKTESLMLTADGGFKLTMQVAVECQLTQGLTPLRLHLGDELQKIELAYENRNSAKRAYKSQEWSHDYRDSLISQYESELLTPET